jgi:hypothetical protein
MKKKSLSFELLFCLLIALVIFGCPNSGKGGITTPIEGTATVSMAAQNGTIMSGTAGSVIFPVTTTNVATGTPGTILWYTSTAGTTAASAPTGITAVVSGDSIVTMTAATSAVAGSYCFKVAYGSATSSVATLLVSSAVISSVTATVDGVACNEGPYPDYLSLGSAASFVYWAEGTQAQENINAWSIQSVGQITGTGTFPIVSGNPKVDYVNTASAMFLLANGSITVTALPTSTGYFTGSFTGTGFWSTSPSTTVSCSGTFSLYHP